MRVDVERADLINDEYLDYIKGTNYINALQRNGRTIYQTYFTQETWSEI